MLTTWKIWVSLGMLGGVLLCSPLPPASAETLSYTGSSTIGEVFLPEVIKAFTAKTGVAFTSVEIPGSTEGFKLMMEGRAAMAGMSRALTEAEKGQKPYATTIGFDPYAIYVHADNPVKNVSDDQLKAIFTGKVTDWQQLGGTAAPIEVVLTDPKTRATVTEFQRLVMANVSYTPAAKILGSHDETLQYVAAHPHAITFASPALKPAGLHIVSIDNAQPSPEAVREGTYQYQRPLLLVTKDLPKGDAQKFVSFVLSRDGQAIVAKYFMPVASR